jgi:predicted nucleic acid-binding protein
VRFVDTDILLYAVSTADDAQEKALIARRLLADDDLALSVQVLQDFYVQATRDSTPDRLGHAQALQLVESWLRFPTQEMDVALLRAAMATRARYRVSYSDAAIGEAARILGCRKLLSEDLADGRTFGGVTVENPFARARQGRKP